MNESRSEHDIKNRLAVALGYAQLLQRSDLTPTQRMWTDHIIAACNGEDVNSLERLARQLGVSLAEGVDGAQRVAAMDRMTPALKQALGALTDRRYGPASVILSLAPSGAACSLCGDAVTSGGIRLVNNSHLPAAGLRFQQAGGDCRHEHRVFEQNDEMTSITIHRKGESPE